MAGTKLTLDPARTTLEIRTFAEGALSTLAHNLEIIATRVEGMAMAGETPQADLRIPVESLVVRGVIKGDKVDESAPSRIERGEIERRIRNDVLPRTVAVEVHVEMVNGTAKASIRWAGGQTVALFPAKLEPREDGSWITSGGGPLLLSALGVKPIVGPLRVFRVVDAIRIRWEAIFLPVPQ